MRKAAKIDHGEESQEIQGRSLGDAELSNLLRQLKLLRNFHMNVELAKQASEEGDEESEETVSANQEHHDRVFARVRTVLEKVLDRVPASEVESRTLGDKERFVLHDLLESINTVQKSAIPSESEIQELRTRTMQLQDQLVDERERRGNFDVPVWIPEGSSLDEGEWLR